MCEENNNVKILVESHFKEVFPVSYDKAWMTGTGANIAVLEDDSFKDDKVNNSWSSEIEEIHEEPTKNGWIDVYERENVINTVADFLHKGNKTVVEFGASVGYMIEEMKNIFPHNRYIATDLMMDGLKQSFNRNPDIQHIRCDFTDAPFKTNTVDLVYALNVLEHIEDDVQTIKECYRILKLGGECLFVVPRGENLYDYFDEMLFHKRRYAKGELCAKCISAGFKIEKNFHFAWLCYPAFYLKKKWNRLVGKRLSAEEKVERVKTDIKNAMESSIATNLMHFEHRLSKVIQPDYGVREFILCKKES